MTSPAPPNQPPGGGGEGTAMGGEPRFSVPAGPLYAVSIGVAVVAVLVSAWAAGHWADAAAAGALGAGVSGVTALAGILILRPGKSRPVSDWLTVWLAATVVRLLATPLLAGSLYSALPLPGRAFMLSVAGAYLACLLAETLWFARSVHDSLARTAASRGASTPEGDRSSPST